MFPPSKSNLEEILKLLGAAVQQFDRKKFYCCILCFLYCSFNEKPYGRPPNSSTGFLLNRIYKTDNLIGRAVVKV